MTPPNESLKPTGMVMAIAVLSLLVLVGYLGVMSYAFNDVSSSGEESTEDKTIPLVIETSSDRGNPSKSLDDLRKRVNVEDGVINYWATGSSSCPPTIEKAEIRDFDGQEVVILYPIIYPAGTMCTMDMVGFSQEIYREDGEEIDSDIDIRFDPKWLLGEGRHSVEDLDGEVLFDNRGSKVIVEPLTQIP